MLMHYHINLGFTPRALALRAGLDDTHFHYDASIPFPGIGDFIAFIEDGGEQVFVVIKRKFAFTPDQVTLEILLDMA